MSTVDSSVPGLDLDRSIRWMFKSPNWIANLVWVFLCMLLSSLLIGSFVLIGYQMDIVQRRSRGGEDQDVDFNPDRFAEYLVRGLIPAAIYFVLGTAFGSIAFLFVLVWGAVTSVLLGGGGEVEGIRSIAVLLPTFGSMLLLGFAFLMIGAPLAVRGGLSNDLSEGFKLNWAIQTAKFMWPHVLLFLLYVVVCSLLSYLGLLACFVGIFATAAWLQLVISDLGAQLYDIYLYKGGEPIPMYGETLQAEVI